MTSSDFSTLQISFIFFLVTHLCILKIEQIGTMEKKRENLSNTSREQLMLNIYSTVMHWYKQSA